MKSTVNQAILVDAGPLYALFDVDDIYHERSVHYFQKLRGRLVTTWPVLAETCHLLYRFRQEAQLDFLAWATGALELPPQNVNDLREIEAYMRKYHDLPMDLADASLVLLAIQSGIREIATIDRDFDIYRLPDRSKIKSVFELQSQH